MKQTAFVVGWGALYPGREHLALEGFHEWVTILDELKQKSEIELRKLRLLATREFAKFSMIPTWSGRP